MKHSIKTVKWYWCNKKLILSEQSPVWKMSCENSQSYLECVETSCTIFLNTIVQKSHRIKNLAIKEYWCFGKLIL